MKRLKLGNGLTIIHENRDSDTVAIEVSVGTGSNNEPSKIAGMSHFLEHMAFEGTKTRSAKEISEAIENIGGEINAATSNERTFFYVKVPKKHAVLGLDILADILQNPSFEKDIFEKERKVVLEEIKMVDDQPMLYQWVLFEKSIFKKHPSKNPVYGRFDSVRSMTREQMIAYYRKWYVPNNMVVCVVGCVPDVVSLVKSRFGGMKRRPVPEMHEVIEPKDSMPTIKKEKWDTNQAYMILGNKTVDRSHKDSFALDVISAIFSKGISGRVTEEIRVKRGLAYSVGTVHECKKDYGFFAFYLNCDRKNLELCKRIIFDEIKKLSNLSVKELNEAKEHIIGRLLLDDEDSHKRADDLAFWEFIHDMDLADSYKKEIRKVSVKDIIKARDKYLDENYTLITLSK